VKTNKLTQLLSTSKSVISRFPLAILCSVTTTILFMYLTGSNNGENDQLIKIALSISLGIPAFTAAKLLHENKALTISKPVIYTLTFAVLGLVLWSNVYLELDGKIFIIRLMILHVLFILLISISHHVKSNRSISLSKFNATLFIHTIEAIVSTIIIYAVLSLAIFSLENLFNVDIGSMVYLRLFILISGIFTPIYILSGIPRQDSDQGFEDISKNRFYKILTNYIFIPAVLLYGFILYAYSIRILLFSSEINEWVGHLIIWFFVLGVLSYLLNYVYKEKEDNLITYYFLKYFYPVSFPLLFLLFYIVYLNVREVGFTDELYYSIVVCFWLVLTSIYFILSKKDNIKWIPITLIIVGIISIYGPLSLFNTVVNSQYKIATNGLEKAGYLKDGKLTAVNKYDIDRKTFDAISVIEDYEALDKISKLYVDNEIENLSLSHFSYRNDIQIDDWFNVYNDQNNVIKEIKDYTDFMILNFYSIPETVTTKDYRIKVKKDELIIIYKDDENTIPLENWIVSLITDSKKELNFANDNLSIKIIAKNISGKRRGSEVELESGELLLFINTKSE